MLRQEDIAELVKRNIGLLQARFGGWIHTDLQLYIDLEKAPAITPQCVYQKHNEQELFNGQDFLEMEKIDIVKKMLLQEIFNEQRKEFRVSRDRGIHNLVLFRHRVIQKTSINVAKEQQALQPQSSPCVEARRKALFLFDFNLERTKDNHQQLQNVLGHICGCAYGFATQQSEDMKQLCKLYTFLKSGQTLGAFQVLTNDFLSDPEQQLRFLETVNTNLDPRTLYSQKQWQRNWMQQKPVNFEEILDRLRSLTEQHRQRKLNELQEDLDRISQKQSRSQQELDVNVALEKTFKIDLNEILAAKTHKDKLNNDIGNDNDKLREMINKFLIISLWQRKGQQEDRLEGRQEALSEQDHQQIIDHFANKAEIKTWFRDADIYDLF